MKLAEDSGILERDGIVGESSFSIAATPKAFEILSSKLYTDIPRAIVRELSTNAFDAHVEAGCTNTPFIAHLPNRLEPYFEIRDFGPGLSPKLVREIYTVYFASTRNKSNEFAGCLGLGSKSPLSYTDQFLVTSYVDGVAYSYSIFKNESKEPNIALLTKNDTSEPNGVCVRIAVKQGDFHAFYEAASKVYSYFSVKPEIKGSNSVNLNRSKPEITGDGYEIGAASQYGDNCLIVVMGQVAYRVSQIDITKYGFTGYSTKIELNANIGECQTSASREELHMDKTTKAWIESKLNGIIEDLRERMKIEIANAASTLEAVYINNLYAARFHNLRRTVTLEGDKAGCYLVRSCEVRTTRRGRNKLLMDRAGRDMSGSHKDKPVVIIENDCGQDDIPLKMRAKIMHWYTTDATSPNFKNRGHFYIAKVIDRQAFEKDFGKSVIKLSNLPDPPKAVSSISGITMERNKSCIRSLTPNGRWENVEKFEDSESCAIVLRNGNKVVFNGAEYDVAFVQRMMIFTGVQTIYGIPTRVMNKYDGAIPNIFDFCKENVEETIAEMTEYEIAALKQEPTHQIDEDVLKGLANINPICQDFTAYIKAYRSMQHRNEIAHLAGIFGVPVLDKPDYQGIFHAKYPLVYNLHRHFYGAHSSIIPELEIYIKAKGV